MWSFPTRAYLHTQLNVFVYQLRCSCARQDTSYNAVTRKSWTQAWQWVHFSTKCTGCGRVARTMWWKQRIGSERTRQKKTKKQRHLAGSIGSWLPRLQRGLLFWLLVSGMRSAPNACTFLLFGSAVRVWKVCKCRSQLIFSDVGEVRKMPELSGKSQKLITMVKSICYFLQPQASRKIGRGCKCISRLPVTKCWYRVRPWLYDTVTILECRPHVSFLHSYQYEWIQAFAIHIRSNFQLIAPELHFTCTPISSTCARDFRARSLCIHVRVGTYIMDELPLTACCPKLFPAMHNPCHLIWSQRPKLQFGEKSTKCLAVAVRWKPLCQLLIWLSA